MQACISASKAASSDALVFMRSMAAPPAKVSRLIAEASQTAPPKLLHAAKKYMITLSQHASGHAWTCNLNTCMGDIISGTHKPKSNSTKHSKNTTPNWAFFVLRLFALFCARFALFCARFARPPGSIFYGFIHRKLRILQYESFKIKCSSPSNQSIVLIHKFRIRAGFEELTPKFLHGVNPAVWDACPWVVVHIFKNTNQISILPCVQQWHTAKQLSVAEVCIGLDFFPGQKLDDQFSWDCLGVANSSLNRSPQTGGRRLYTLPKVQEPSSKLWGVHPQWMPLAANLGKDIKHI